MTPRWLSWLLIAAILYFAFTAHQAGQLRDQPGVAPMAMPTITPETYPKLAETFDIEGWKRALDPSYAAVMNCAMPKPRKGEGLDFTILEKFEGMGMKAECGEKVWLKLTVWDAQGARLYQGTHAVQLGSQPISGAIDAGVPGMRMGAIRWLLVPAHAQSRASSAPLSKSLQAAFDGTGLRIVEVTRLTPAAKPARESGA
jgi:hypothetical protein